MNSKNSIFLFISVILLSCVTAWANDNLFEQANQAYTRGDTRQAINLYLEHAAREGVSGSLLYNLANSYAAAGMVGPAVLNYERALRLAPGDSDIQANLEQVRKDAGLYRDDQPLYERLAGMLGADQWLMLAGSAFLLLTLTAITAFAGRKIPATAVRLIVIASLLVIITTLPPALLRYQSWNDGVVTGENVKLLISPFTGAASSGTIKEGRLVHPEKTHGNYALVRDKTGRSGWIANNDFERIAELPGR
jgi:tetratricopeptide (TPR) repeat protein